MRRKTILSLLIAVAVIFSVGANVFTASASTQSKKLVSDSFNDVDYAGKVDGDKWVTFNAEGSSGVIAQQSASDSALYFVNGISGGEQAMLTTTTRFSNIESVQYDVKLTSEDNRYSNNLTFIQESVLDEGMKHTDVNGLYVYNAAFLIRGGCISTPENVSETNPTGAGATWDALFGTSEIANKWIRVKVVPIDEVNAEIYLALLGDGVTDIPSTPTCVINWCEGNDTRSFKEGYIGWATTTPNNGQFIDNIIIKADGRTIEEDFSADGNVSWEEKDQFQVIGPNKNAGGFVLYDESALEIKNTVKGDRIISTKEVLEDKSTVNDIIGFEVSFNIKFNASAPSSDEVAFTFNLPSKDASPLEDSYAYVIKKTGGRLERYVGGEKVAFEKSNKNAFSYLTSENGATVKITVNKNGEFTVYENGRKVQGSFDKVEDYTGYFGFATLSSCTDTVEVDNFNATNRTYYVPRTKSVTHDFSNDFFGNADYLDFYTSQIPENSLYVENGRLVMKGASDGTFFGSAHQYDSFIMDYTICNIFVGTGDGLEWEETKPNRWIGLDVSRASKTASDYGTYAMLYFTIAPTEGQDSVRLNLYTKESSVLSPSDYTVSEVRPIPAEYFNAISYDGSNKTKADVLEDDGVCVRWVSENGVLKLYLKKFGETDFTLYYTVFGLELKGYFALCNTGYLHAELDNFSMANTSPKYVCAPNEAPETQIVEKETIIYDEGNVDVNWDKELNLNPVDAKTDGKEEKGCFGSLSGMPILMAIGLLGFIVIKRKK